MPRDLRLTLRLLAARPGWTFAAVLCLGIATGANTAAFTLVNGLLLRPLPYDEPAQLVMVALRDPRQTSPRPFALREYRDLAERSATTASLLARTFFPLSLAAADGARMAQAELVSGNYFETLRVAPFAGRFFDARADRDDGAPVVVLSHRLWKERFGADPAIVGLTVRVNGRPVTVAGVAPPGFVGGMQLVAADLWLPATMYPELAGLPDAAAIAMFGVMGRLAPGVTPRQAEARLTAANARPPDAAGNPAPLVIVRPATGFGVPVAAQPTVLTLSGFIYAMMALLMTVACSNVAALVLARGAGRSREIAVRLSLGATRLHIARQLLTESLVLAVAGSAVGMVVALWLTRALVARLSTPFQYVSYAVDVQPDARVFLYSAIATLVAAALCGIAPIRAAGRVGVVEVLKQSAAKGRSRKSMRAIDAMVVGRFAASTALLAAAGMVLRTYVDAQSIRPAFDTAGLIAATLDIDQVRADRQTGIRLYRAAIERLAALPGVAGVGVTRQVPVTTGATVAVTTGRDDSAERATAAALAVSAGYFGTLGLSIREGRTFEDAEPLRPRVAVVDETLARRLWPDRSPIGETFRPARPGADPMQVIGVVANVRDAGRGEPPPVPTFYQPFTQDYSAKMTLLVRAQGDPDLQLGAIRRTVGEVHQDLAIVDLRTVDALIDGIAGQRRIPATALGLVGLLALLLSAVGLYGVVAFGVRERARELGIRLALGARPADVRRIVLRQGFTIVAIGLAIGIAATVALSRILRSLLFGAAASDPATVIAVCAVLAAAGFVALYLPARWASRLEPALTLRAE